MDTHCFSRLGTPLDSSQAFVIARCTMLFPAILQCPFLLLVASFTSSRPIPRGLLKNLALVDPVLDSWLSTVRMPHDP